MKFDETRFGYGVANDRIVEGAKGYFSNDYRVMRTGVTAEIIETNYYLVYGTLTDVNIEGRDYPYASEYNTLYKFFYLVEEAPAFTAAELVDMIGTRFKCVETGEVYDLHRVIVDDYMGTVAYLKAQDSNDYKPVAPTQLRNEFRVEIWSTGCDSKN